MLLISYLRHPLHQLLLLTKQRQRALICAINKRTDLCEYECMLFVCMHKHMR